MNGLYQPYVYGIGKDMDGNIVGHGGNLVDVLLQMLDDPDVARRVAVKLRAASPFLGQGERFIPVPGDVVQAGNDLRFVEAVEGDVVQVTNGTTSTEFQIADFGPVWRLAGHNPKLVRS